MFSFIRKATIIIMNDYEFTGIKNKERAAENELCNILDITPKQLYALKCGYKRRRPALSTILILTIILCRTEDEIYNFMLFWEIDINNPKKEIYKTLGDILLTLLDSNFKDKSIMQRRQIAEYLLVQNGLPCGLEDLDKYTNKKL